MGGSSVHVAPENDMLSYKYVYPGAMAHSDVISGPVERATIASSDVVSTIVLQ